MVSSTDTRNGSPGSRRDASVVESIKEDLRTQILTGRLREGATVPSEHELAARFGVNRNYTRLALRDLAQEGYILRARGRRSVVAPRAGKGGAAPSVYERPTVALVQPECMTRFCRDVMNGFMSRATQGGFQAIAYNLRFDDESELEFLHHVREQGLRGIALWLQRDTEETRGLLARFVEERFPLVLVDRYVPGLDVDHVVTDNEALARHLTKCLLDGGHERIGFVTDEFNYTSTRDRHAGWEKALREAGREPEDRYVLNLSADPDGASAAIHALMAYCERPTAFFCVHDASAKILASELKRLGYRIPEHVAIAAVDDEHYAATLGIPLITARQQSYEIGRQAAEILERRLKDPGRPSERRVLPPLFSEAGAEGRGPLHPEGVESKD